MLGRRGDLRKWRTLNQHCIGLVDIGERKNDEEKMWKEELFPFLLVGGKGEER